MDFKSLIVEYLDKNLEELSYEEIDKIVEVPKDSKLGDWAMPCFSLAKVLKKAPNMIADDLKAKLEVPNFLEKIESTSGYLNFFINRSSFSKEVLNEIYNNEEYGKTNIGDNKTVVIDYASLNIAKPFHIGHLKNAVTGDSLYRIFKYLGYNCIGINHLGDFGTQFGKLIYAYKTWGDDEKIKERGIYELNDLYIKFHEEAEKNPSIEEEGKAWSYKIEKKDEEALRIWNFFKDISLEYFNKLSDKLDLHFDKMIGESFYIDFVEDTVRKIDEKGILVESEGAKIVELDNMTPALILRSDGASLYTTRDIAAAMYRKENFNFDKCIYITGSEQKLHFAQWFKVIEKMGYDWHDGLVHIAHGMVRLEEGKISSRKGNAITLEETIKEAKEKALDIINSSGRGEIPNKEQTAEDIGLGAMIFNNLYNNCNKDVTFSWDSALRFDGETGPYLQYTHARTCSILKKIGDIDLSKVDTSILNEDSAFEIVKTLSTFGDVVKAAGEKYEPSYVTRFIMDLAQKFNKFYNECQIAVNDDTVRNTRGMLTFTVNRVLKIGLSLICMKAPTEM